MMVSEEWLTTVIIMLQQADRMRRTYHLILAASIFQSAGSPHRRTVERTALFIATDSCDSLALFDPTYLAGTTANTLRNQFFV